LIIVDTSVWIDHLRSGNQRLSRLLDRGQVLAHPWVIGELALGNLQRRVEILRLLDGLPQATIATESEVMKLIDQHELYGSGIGYVDAQLLAATRLSGDGRLWTLDARLASPAATLGVADHAG